MSLSTQKRECIIDLNNPDLVERLAELEHLQWMEWSKDIARKENLSDQRLKRWRKYWVPYPELPNDVKEQDRKWANQALKLLNDWWWQQH